jgi:hypothetical protein
MKHYLGPVFALAAFAILTFTNATAQPTEKMVIALKTNDFELTETDISTMAIGEAQTIETQSGKIIDILRTADGAEVYVDGELLEMNLDGQDMHEKHMMQRHVEIVCDSSEECDESIFIFTSDENEVSELVMADEDHVFILKEVEITCTDDDEGVHCDDEHIDMDSLHGEHKQIVIRKEHIIED